MENSSSSDLIELKEELKRLSQRISIVENTISQLIQEEKLLSRQEIFKENPEPTKELIQKEERSIEFRVGEYGMAWLGNIVLLFGIAFLVEYLQNNGNLLLSAFASYLSIVIIYAASYFSRNAFSHLSKLFSYSGHLLLFYFTLKLHFFEMNPLIESKLIGLSLLTLVVGLLFYLSYRKKSQLLASLVFLMALISGIVSNNISFTALMTAVVSILTIALYARFGWLKLVFAFIFLVYLFHLNWLLNNPVMGNPLEPLEGPGTNYLTIITTAIAFSLIAIVPDKKDSSDQLIITAVVWNGVLFTITLAVSTLLYFKDSYITLYSAIAVFCLAYSILLQSRSAIKITAAMYALYSFLAMSVAFYGIFLLPEAYALLALESLLVVSMALWFHSRFIVVMNSMMFLILLIFYLGDATSYSSIDFSFMLVAFLTARIINWKKERLNLKTEFIRNFYLVAGFTMTLIAFYHAFPESYITASWILAALLFFATSLLLRNIKYRWLAIGSLIGASIKLIFIDMSNIDIGYRVLIFLLLAIISITASILYTRFYKEKKE